MQMPTNYKREALPSPLPFLSLSSCLSVSRAVKYYQFSSRVIAHPRIRRASCVTAGRKRSAVRSDVPIVRKVLGHAQLARCFSLRYPQPFSLPL